MAGEWRPDPGSKHELRYHDGEQWTEHVSDHGTRSVDPIGARPEATAAVPIEMKPPVDPRAPYGATAAWQPEPTKGGMSGGKVAAIAAACSLVALLFGIGIGAAGSSDKKANVAATGTTTTNTTLSPEQAAAAAARQAAAEKATADQAAAAKAAADKAVTEKAAADKAAAAAQRAAAAPRTFSGTGSKITEKFPLMAGGYKVAWKATGATDNFILLIHDSAGNRYPSLVSEIPPEPSSGETHFESRGGEFYLEIDASELAWTVTLTKV